MGRERVAAEQAIPVRPVPSLKPRDPAVDKPDYILMSATRFDEILDFVIKNKVRSPIIKVQATCVALFALFLPSITTSQAPAPVFHILMLTAIVLLRLVRLSLLWA
jgi:hypothetical protein